MAVSSTTRVAPAVPASATEAGSARRRHRTDVTLANRVAGPVMVVVVVVFMTPFLWAGLTAVKPFADAFQNPPVWLFAPQGDAFTDLWRRTLFAKVLLNTVLVAVVSVVVSLVVGAPAAYAFARFRGRIGPLLLVLALVFRALPRFAVVLPFYSAARAVGLYDTDVALVVVFVAVNMPFTLLLLTGFFRELPEQLDEAAMVDGCSRLSAFRKVIVPLTGPGLVTAGLFAFLLAFQEYLVALTLTQNNATTIPVFVAAQAGADDIGAFQLLAACSIALVVPIVLITIFARRYFVAGLAGGAVKG